MNAYIDIDIDIYTLCLESDVCHLITESFRRNSAGDREKALSTLRERNTHGERILRERHKNRETT